MNIYPREVFRSPTLREVFGVGASLLVGGYLLISLLLAAASLLINQVVGVAALVMIVLGFASLGLRLWLSRGTIVLEEDGVVESYPLNRVRKFRYAQIFEVKRGNHIDQIFIRYYPLQKDGQIDYRRYQGVHLMGVKDHKKLRFELVQRMAAPPPAFTHAPMPSRRQVLLILLLLILVALAAIPYILHNLR